MDVGLRVRSRLSAGSHLTGALFHGLRFLDIAGFTDSKVACSNAVIDALGLAFRTTTFAYVDSPITLGTCTKSNRMSRKYLSHRD